MRPIKERARRAYDLACTWGQPLLGLVFIAASLPKLSFPLDFLSGIYGYELLGPEVGVIAAMVLPWFEFIVGAFLMLDVLAVESLLLTMLLLLFIGVQGYALAGGLEDRVQLFRQRDGRKPY